ncbi:hypothetical protein DEO72_LG1g1969 [Vigna unguiculata]|uniref:Uncharacterized protein n=1 Tax=Vigna unguiculata TaxID=3917 RepID=A0A4D6KRJ3_VIGUN|nr:hypothetical protein DEO72_LG1g1969 [Vigna unguiculata]
MNPHVQGDSAGEGNASNQNYYRPRLSSETQEMVLPLFPLFATEEAFPHLDMNLPQPGANNIRATIDVPFNVVAPESNIFSSSPFLAGTPPNPMENLDLCLNVGLRRHGAAISSAVIPSSNAARSVHGSNSNSVNIPEEKELSLLMVLEDFIWVKVQAWVKGQERSKDFVLCPFYKCYMHKF